MSVHHCAYVFDCLLYELGPVHPTIKDLVDVSPPHPQFDDHLTESPLFVTFKKRASSKRHHRHRRDDSEEWELRGCIGTFSPLPLGEGLRQYTVQSAFRDRRFYPIEVARGRGPRRERVHSH
eukprot:EC785570.1.p2 GENE.EC785570.1~~EC785570.1.p2  ORF type:complete len:122 (+),score=12.95 EC785570.1:26-391(+)